MSSSSVHADPPPPIVVEPTGISYATGSALGKGGFAICHRAERYNDNKATGQVFALKIVKTKMEPAKLAQKFVTELQIHSKLSHPNIVTFYRAFCFQTSTYVVLELCPNGSLADLLKRRKYLTLPEIRRLIIQVCGAVKYLHYRHIVHRDLKTGNLFLDQNMNVKVGDFGLAALLVTEKEMEVKRRTTMCGTPNYLAPEILEKGKGHDEKVDLWAIGIIAYTLAVGKAPFHASTKEEIYKKLRSGTYAWPELSATTNQSSDLRDLVSSLLVPEEQRPLPDRIVSHSFFRIAFVPSAIPTSAREKAPSWPEVSIPSAEVIRRGYSDAWFHLCKESGVGEYKDGECFPLNGGRKVRSIVHDMAKEAQAGRQPTMPIPKDVVYTSTVNDWDRVDGKRSSPAETLSGTVTSRGLKELSHNEVATTRPRVTERERETAAAEVDLMPPPRAPSRLNRAGTTRKAARTISEENAKPNEALKIASDSSSAPSATLRLAKTRQPAAPSSSTALAITALKELNASSTSAYQTAQSQQIQETESAKPQAATNAKRSADASLARRPRGGRTMRERPLSPIEVAEPSRSNGAKTMKERPLSMVDAPKPVMDLDELKHVSPFKYRRKPLTTDVIEILSDPEPESNNVAGIETGLRNLKLPPPPQMSKPLPVPHRRTASGINATVPGTDPSTVLERLAMFRDNLAAALSKPTASTRPISTYRSTAPEVAANLPFVSRWVDYSRKHGIGYVLSDGTVGVIINRTTKPNHLSTPVTHVFARNGQRWLQKLGNKSKDYPGIEQVPLEVFEDGGDTGIQRKVYKGLGSVKEGPLLAEAERRRTLAILWAKFGRYMCQSLDGEEADGDGAAPSAPTTAATGLPSSSSSSSSSSRFGGAALEQNFVRFYQRIGNVGLWLFADGCLQVHFPDHTKLVLAADARAVSATVLSLDAAAHLARHAELLPQHVAGRQLLADETTALLRESPLTSTAATTATIGGGRVRQRVVRANQLAEKLWFVLEVVSQWVANGGLGRLDEDAGGKTGISWEGLAVKENAKKSDRVTVGRYGGDDAGVGAR